MRPVTTSNITKQLIKLTNTIKQQNTSSLNFFNHLFFSFLLTHIFIFLIVDHGREK